jgi:spermidine/putrescine transport system permease protein
MSVRSRRRGRPPPPWRTPFLATWTVGYFVWSLAPIALLIRASFADPSAFRGTRGFSLAWYEAAITDPDLRGALFHSLLLAGSTALLATPLGVSLAVGLASWASRRATLFRSLALAPLAVPPIVLAGGSFFAFLYPLGVIGFGRDAQIIGHVTIALPYVVLLIWARLFSISRELEETAMDLGASRTSTFVRVTIPLLLPSIMSAMALAFVLSFDNLPVSQYLCIRECRTVPMLLYGRGQAVGLSPAVVALGTMSMVATLVAMAIFFSSWKLSRRWSERAEAR